MNAWKLNRRLGSLAERLKNDSVEGSTRIDPDCLSESERALLNRVYEIIDEYRGCLPPDHVLRENMELFVKCIEIIVRRVIDLFVSVMPSAFGGGELEEWYFKLHFYNFLADWTECINNVRKWSEKDRAEFLRDMKQSGMLDKVFRLPRGLAENDLKAEGKEK